MKIIVVLLVFVIMLALIWKLTGSLLTDGFSGVMSSRGVQTPYNKNTIEMTQSGGGYYIQMKNVVGTVAADRPGEKTYYNLDITLETTSSGVAEQLTTNREYTVSVVRDSLSKFSSADLASPQGQDLLKSDIRQSLSGAYNTDKIDNIYIEKFLYQND